MKIFRLTVTTSFFLFHALAVAAQNSDGHFQPLQSKRFIDKIEVFAGPSFSFNYGNKFVENYKDENYSNKRLGKVGYAFGLGLFHPLSQWFDMNIRLQYERKGTNTELNLPIYMGRLIINSEYTYNYLTLVIGPKVLLGNKRNISLEIGGYYSKIQSVTGREEVYNTRDNTTTKGSFKGRSIRGLDNNGGVVTLTFIPGLRSFENSDYGLTIGFGYLFKIKRNDLSIRLNDNFGLQNINKREDGNSIEKNHTISIFISYILKRQK